MQDEQQMSTSLAGLGTTTVESRFPRPRTGLIRVVLPAYNEEKALPELLHRLDLAFEEAGLPGDVLVVNDGSTDGTGNSVRGYSGRLPVQLMDFESNRGLAEAIKTGLMAAAAKCLPGDIVITMDADNSHTPGLILRMVRMVREGCDVVIASRYQPGSRVRGVSLFRRILSRGAGLLFSVIVRIPGVRDYTCGYRAYRGDLLRAAFERYHDELVRESGFGCMAEILLKLKPLDPIIQEVPLILRYDLKPSASKMDVGRTIRQTLALLSRYIFRGPEGFD